MLPIDTSFPMTAFWKRRVPGDDLYYSFVYIELEAILRYSNGRRDECQLAQCDAGKIQWISFDNFPGKLPA